jgi:hypothetical protein
MCERFCCVLPPGIEVKRRSEGAVDAVLGSEGAVQQRREDGHIVRFLNETLAA